MCVVFGSAPLKRQMIVYDFTAFINFGNNLPDSRFTANANEDNDNREKLFCIRRKHQTPNIHEFKWLAFNCSHMFIWFFRDSTEKTRHEAIDCESKRTLMVYAISINVGSVWMSVTSSTRNALFFRMLNKRKAREYIQNSV